MSKQLKEISVRPSSEYEQQVERKMPNLLVAPPKSKRRPQQAGCNKSMDEVNKAMEKIAKEAKLEEDLTVKKRYSYAEAVGFPLTWLPLFIKLGMEDDDKAIEKPMLPLRIKRRPAFAQPEPQEKLENWKARFGVSKKDQSTQTYFIGERCPICLREEDRRLYGLINLEQPSKVDPARCNKYTREASIECPDRTYYGSEQLTFIRVGRLVYRGWTYVTPDGRIEHMPRVPRGIPIDELRVEKPLRTPAPR